MDLNTYRKNVEDAKTRYLDQSKAAVESASKAGGFGQELKDSISQREDTYKTLNNDVNTQRANYYNSSEQILPQLFEKYKNDPLYALQALGNENTTRQVNYRNADDIRNQKQGRVEDFIGSFSQAAQREAAKQEALTNQLKEAYGIADNEYNRASAEDQAKKAAAAQASYYADLLKQQNGGGNGDQPTYDPNTDNTYKNPGKYGERRVGIDGVPRTFNGTDWVEEQNFINANVAQRENKPTDNWQNAFGGSNLLTGMLKQGGGLIGDLGVLTNNGQNNTWQTGANILSRLKW
mgnify:CR=1 FL=1